MVFEWGRCEHTCKCDQAWTSSTLKPGLHCVIQCTPSMQCSWSQYLNLHCWGLRSAAHDAAPPITQCRLDVMCQTNKYRGMLEGEVQTRHQPNTELVGVLTSPLDIPEIRNFSQFSVCLSVRLWFILRVFGNSGKEFPCFVSVYWLLKLKLFVIFLPSLRVNAWVVYSETTTVYFQTHTYSEFIISYTINVRNDKDDDNDDDDNNNNNNNLLYLWYI